MGLIGQNYESYKSRKSYKSYRRGKNKMKVLITGGAGFIGSHLAEGHLERGDEVYIIDDLSTGSMDNIGRIKGLSNFHYYLDSVTNHHLMAELVDLCDAVYHLAAAVGVRLIVESPVKTIEANIRGTEVVLHHAAKKRKRVLIASTSEVYGKRDQVPFGENDDLVMGATDKGRWSYACSKAIDEFLASPTGKRRRSRPSSRASSTPSARARQGATGWSSRISSGRRSVAKTSPFTATALRAAASRTFRM